MKIKILAIVAAFAVGLVAGVGLQTANLHAKENNAQSSYDYLPQVMISSTSGTKSVGEFQSKWNGTVNIWFDNHGSSDVEIELREKGWFDHEQEISSMTVLHNQADGKYFSIIAEKGKTYYAHLKTLDGAELYGEMKISVPNQTA